MRKNGLTERGNMKNLIKKGYYWQAKKFKAIWRYAVGFVKFKKDKRFAMPQRETRLLLGDMTKNTSFDRHYIYHTAWAARVLKKTMPEKHVDISSSLYFCSIVSAFVPVDFYDFRPVSIALDNLETNKVDLTSLHFEDDSIRSLSCMHTIEHVGLGRYGDEIDVNNDQLAISELKRVLKKGGDLLFVVPIGKPRVVYNAHRIYSYEQVREYFSGFDLKEFALVPDTLEDKDFIYNPSREIINKQMYACGCFWFNKK